MNVLVWVVFLFLTVALSCLWGQRDNFVSELIFSFLPYFFVFACCMVVLGILLLLRKKTQNPILKFILVQEIIVFGILWALTGKEIHAFYGTWEDTGEVWTWVKVFYANILYTNTGFDILEQTITKEQPDVVVLVEFSDLHKENMEDFFRTNYPYMSRNSWSETLAWDIIFSKYPLENIGVPVTKGTWTYSHLTLSPLHNEKIDLYVVHTAAPVSLEKFVMRNRQLDKLANDLQQERKNNKSESLMIGDFNLSPWSFYYQQFIEKLWDDFQNQTNKNGIDYTRSFLGQKIMRSHIDQLFTTKGIKIHQFYIEDLLWSDHRYFSFFFEY